MANNLLPTCFVTLIAIPAPFKFKKQKIHSMVHLAWLIYILTLLSYVQYVMTKICCMIAT